MDARDAEIRRLKQRLADARHQLVTLDGLYASDQEDFAHPFRIDLKAALKRLEAQ